MTQAYNLSQLANNINTAGQIDATDGLVNAVPVANGGTGATTASAARTNLGVAESSYPVGSIYMNAANATNPASLLGFGTWAAMGAGRVLIGNGGGFSAGATGGSADAVVVSHTHTATTTATDSGHAHAQRYNGGTSGAGGGISNTGVSITPVESLATAQSSANITASTSVSSAGVSGTNANLQPYLVVYMWQRTA